jgi:hypothetical protein
MITHRAIGAATGAGVRVGDAEDTIRQIKYMCAR